MGKITIHYYKLPSLVMFPVGLLGIIDNPAVFLKELVVSVSAPAPAPAQ